MRGLAVWRARDGRAGGWCLTGRTPSDGMADLFPPRKPGPHRLSGRASVAQDVAGSQLGVETSGITTSLCSAYKKAEIWESDGTEDELRLMKIFQQGRVNTYPSQTCYEFLDI